MSDLISGTGCNFARTGDPNGPGLPEWPPFTAASPKVMSFGAETGVRPVPNLESSRPWTPTTPGVASRRRSRESPALGSSSPDYPI